MDKKVLKERMIGDVTEELDSLKRKLAYAKDEKDYIIFRLQVLQTISREYTGKGYSIISKEIDQLIDEEIELSNNINTYEKCIQACEKELEFLNDMDVKDEGQQ